MSTKAATGMLELNPNAPLFIPAAYLAAEDFSPQWWHLVQTCPAFRDYWLRERYDAIDDGATSFEDVDEFDVIDIQNEMQMEELEHADDLAYFKQENGATRETEKDLLCSLVSLNLNGTPSPRQWHEPLKHHEKITNNSQRSPRRVGNNQPRIHQPRSQ